MQELEKILEEIDKRIEHVQKAFINNENMPGYLLYKKTMEETKEIIRKHMDDGWISVEDRLPEAEEHVRYAWVTIDHGTIRQRILVKWNGEEFKSIYGTRIYNRIVAWKKCSPPKPYRPERS